MVNTPALAVINDRAGVLGCRSPKRTTVYRMIGASPSSVRMDLYAWLRAITKVEITGKTAIGYQAYNETSAPYWRRRKSSPSPTHDEVVRLSDPGIPKGVFRPVLISSAAVLGACVLTWSIVGTLSQTEPEALVDPAPRLAVTGLATLTILSAASILATLILRGQRQLADRLDVLLLTDERVRGRAEHDAEIVPLPSPDAVAAVRRLAARLTGTEG